MAQMTEADWKKQEKKLNAAIRKARKESMRNVTLDEKIKLKRAVQTAIQALSKHRLDYHGLVHGALPLDAPTEFYMQDSRQLVGNVMMWWAFGGNGYVSDITKAKVFTRDQAVRQHESRSTDVPWPKSYIDARTQPAADHQVVCLHKAIAEPADVNSFYMQVKGEFSGNSIVWRASNNKFSASLSKAAVYTKAETLSHNGLFPEDVAWPKRYIDDRSWPVVTTSEVNLDTALALACIKLAPADYVEPRQPVNCGSCGAFNSERQVYVDGCPKCGADNRP